MGSLIYGTAIHIREQAKIDAARITRASGNAARGAQAALGQTAKSLSNLRAMDAAGQQVNNIQGNIAKNLDAAATGDFQTRIAAAEELGANAAYASAAGLGGSSVEAYNNTLRLQQAMQQEGTDRALKQDLGAASSSLGFVMSDAVAGLDNSNELANLDYTINVDHKKQGTLSKLFTLGLAAAATYAGGPQAGMAVLSMNEAKQAANNGDFGAASGHLSSAIQSGVSGVQTYNRTKAGPSANADYWDSVRKKQHTSSYTSTSGQGQPPGLHPFSRTLR